MKMSIYQVCSTGKRPSIPCVGEERKVGKRKMWKNGNIYFVENPQYSLISPKKISDDIHVLCLRMSELEFCSR